MFAAAGAWQWFHQLAVRQIPTLTFTLLSGAKLPTSALRGKPNLVVFWSVTCTPCVKESPHLAAFYRALHTRGVGVVAVALTSDPPSLVLDFTRRFKIPYPVALDLDGSVARAFGGVDVIPRDILVGPSGRIAEDHVGPVDWVRLRARVEQMLNQEPTRTSSNANLARG